MSTVCEKCSQPVSIGDWPFCPHEASNFGIVRDDIPGGIEIKHGLCNEDGTPRRYDSISEIKREAFKRGLVHGDDTPKINRERQDREGEAKYAKARQAKEGRY